MPEPSKNLRASTQMGAAPINTVAKKTNQILFENVFKKKIKK
jgi:hypothetical protein